MADPNLVSDLVIERRWASHPRNVHAARDLARRVVLDYAREEADLIELAVGEACANAVEHGSPEGDHSHFLFRCILSRAESQVVFEVEDEGRDFALTDLSLAQAPDLYAEGGRGLFLINQIMDSVTLHSSARGLTIRMIKHLSCLQARAAGAAARNGQHPQHP